MGSVTRLLMPTFLFQLRLFQQELNVEEIVWERAEIAFNERCRTYYRPES